MTEALEGGARLHPAPAQHKKEKTLPTVSWLGHGPDCFPRADASQSSGTAREIRDLEPVGAGYRIMPGHSTSLIACHWSLLAALAGVCACTNPGDDAGVGTTTGAGDGTDLPATETGDSTGGESSGIASTSDDGSETGDPTGSVAQGITITRVEANQGVGVSIVDGAGWVGPDDRNAALIRDRGMLIRVEHSVEDGWEPRSIDAVLELVDGDVVTERRMSLMVDGDSDPTEPTGHFAFRLDADEVPAGLRFRVRLEEAPGTPGVADNPAAVAPPQLELVGIEDVSSTMEIVLFPIEVEGCDAVPQLDSDTTAPTMSRLRELYPVQELVVDIRDSFVVSEAIQSCAAPALIEALSAVRFAEDGPPNRVYAAVYDRQCVDNTDGCTCASHGIGSRAMQIEMVGDDPQSLASWFDFCSALALGRRQVGCAGTELGPDPDYPYPDGDIGGYGYSVETDELYPPSAKSFMSFCQEPTWVSDYGWNLAYDALRSER